MRAIAIWTIEYDGPQADLSGNGATIPRGARRTASARHRGDIHAPTADEALARARMVFGGARHRVVGRAV
jgi:hypothetical protein